MGVRGLQTYMEKYCHEACHEVSIRDLIETYRRETEREPVIVVDGSSCLRYIYGSLDWVCGGQFIEYKERLLNFVKAFQSLGAKLVFFFDGVNVENKRPVWIKRRLESLRDVYKIFDCLNKFKKAIYVDQSLLILPPGIGITTRFMVRDVCGCEVYTSVRECDEEIAEYARTRRCFAILGQDSDYVIHEGAQFYLSINGLNLRTMRTINYNRWALARRLSIHPNQLAIFASLVGNDIVPAEDLRVFHHNICRRPDGRYYDRNSRIGFDVLIRYVAEFIRTLPCGDDLFQVLPAVAHRVFGDKHRAAQLDASIRSYIIESTEERGDNRPKDHWNHLLTLAKRKHVHAEVPPQMYALMVGDPYDSSTALEDFRDVSFPPAALALRPLRQRIYGLLLHEKPSSGGNHVVVEWCMHGENSLNRGTHVQPISLQGMPHPGLKTLWNDGPNELRWKVFCAAVSPQLDPRQISVLPQHLVVLAASLTYLCQELRPSPLENWEAEALIVQAVIIEDYSAERLSKLEIQGVNIRAVRIATLFLRSTSSIQLLLATCGYPVPSTETIPWKYFDGKLFNSTYNKMKYEAKYEELCCQKASQMEQYLKVRQIALGSVRR